MTRDAIFCSAISTAGRLPKWRAPPAFRKRRAHARGASLDKLYALLSQRGITSTTAGLEPSSPSASDRATPVWTGRNLTSTAVASAAGVARLRPSAFFSL